MKKINLLILATLLASCGTNNISSQTSISEEKESISEVEEQTLVRVKYENPVYDHDFADPSYVKCEE